MSRSREVVLGTGALAVGTLVRSLGCILGAALAAATRMSRGSDDALFGFTIAAALILGGSLATGRLAVWKLVRTNDDGGRPPPVLPTPDGRIVP